MSDRRTLRCERAREWASLGLDRELSEFERALMAAHLRACAGCQRFQEDIAALTKLLRSTPAEMPAPVALPLRYRRPLRAARLRAGQLASAAALVLAAGGLGGFFLPAGPSGADGAELIAAPLAGATGSWNDLVLDLRRGDLKQGRQQVLPAPEPQEIGALKPPRPALPV
jgi:ferric-dicitrate binding protein FerR (iron transport regulator)